jgi:hypothetical protein
MQKHTHKSVLWLLHTVLEVEKDKWGYGNLGGVDDRGAKGPELSLRREAPMIEACSTMRDGFWGDYLSAPSPVKFLKSYMRIYAFRSILAVKK